MGVRITGTIIVGEGSAARNHPVLIPLLAKHVPEVENCSQFGTINIQLDQPLDKSRADIWTPRIVWHPVHLQQVERFGRVEIFGLIKIRFEFPLSGPLYNAWIILPEGSSLTYRDDQAEAIADAFVPDLRPGANCAILIDRPATVAAPRAFGTFYGKSFKARDRAMT